MPAGNRGPWATPALSTGPGGQRKESPRTGRDQGEWPQDGESMPSQRWSRDFRTREACFLSNWRFASHPAWSLWSEDTMLGGWGSHAASGL